MLDILPVNHIAFFKVKKLNFGIDWEELKLIESCHVTHS